LYKLNFGVIMLLPMKEDASRIEQFRPICLLNVSFNFFTKVGTNRAKVIAHKVIKPTQSAFIPGGNILEGVVILHDTIHELHRKKWMVFFLKLISKSLMIKSNVTFFYKP
jgi:hypothetical protein